MTRVGFCQDELQDIGDIDCLQYAVKELADEHHQIDDESDMYFQVISNLMMAFCIALI